jgi:hypothetical protein
VAVKIGRNSPCPCKSGAKYKHCCESRVDWERILTRGSTKEIVTHLTARGKNELFLARVADILGLDTLGRPSKWLDIKRAVTPTAVRDIHEAVATIWPTGEDLKRTLAVERNQDNALYIGMYIPELVARGVARHATYSDTILVVDPFPHPAAVARDFNPILNPHQHRINTLICLRLWFSLAAGRYRPDRPEPRRLRCRAMEPRNGCNRAALWFSRT